MDYERSTTPDFGSHRRAVAPVLPVVLPESLMPASRRRFRARRPPVVPIPIARSIAALPHPQPRLTYHDTTLLPVPLTSLQHHLTVPCCFIITRPPHSNKPFDWTPRAAILRPFNPAAHDHQPLAHKHYQAIAKLNNRSASPVDQTSTVMR